MNNITMNGNGVIIANRKAIINGKEYPFLPNMKGYSVTTINNKVYIDGYAIKNGTWKRTFLGLWYMFF